MNIFYTSNCPKEAAYNLCKRHIVKMILESAQMLSTAHRECGFEFRDFLYKSTHKNHPSSIWVRQSVHHYKWLYEHFTEKCDLYTLITGKVHKTDTKLRGVLSNLPMMMYSKGFTPPPVCMPDEFKTSDVCESYKHYLNGKYREWGRREKPLKVEYPQGLPYWLDI